MARGLIVDDSRFMRRIIAEIITGAGHVVDGEADNGQNGINLYKKLKPDFVTMDITMGGKDGINAVKEIKAKYPGAKIIVISALNENTIRLNDQEIQVDTYITKPFTKEDLLAAINKIL